MKKYGLRTQKTALIQNIASFCAVLIVFTVVIAFKGNLKAEIFAQTLPFFSQEKSERIAQLKEEVEEPARAQDNEEHEKLLGIEDITYDEITVEEKSINHSQENLQDFNYLKKKLYIVDSRTNLLESDIDAQAFSTKNLKIDNTVKGPKILIFHTHSAEGFADSDMSKDMNEGIWGVGERLKEILENQYGIEVLHDVGRYDIVDGKSKIIGAYERMEPSIRKILKDNPSIQFVIDMHRDGVNSNTRLVKEVDGKQCAKVMFFNGLCRVYKNGSLVDTAGLSNPYLQDNLALSLQMQLAAESRYPSFTRKIYISAYRYSLHMLPKSMLIEVGAQTNTKEEAKNAMQPLADILASVILEQS